MTARQKSPDPAAERCDDGGPRSAADPCTYPLTRPWHELASDLDDDRRDQRSAAERDAMTNEGWRR